MGSRERRDVRRCANANPRLRQILSAAHPSAANAPALGLSLRLSNRRATLDEIVDLAMLNPLNENCLRGDVMDWGPIKRAAAAATFLIVHTLLATLFIVCMYFFETLIRLLWGGQEPLLFGRLPVAYIFHLIDLGVLAVFGYRGILAANKAFEE